MNKTEKIHKLKEEMAKLENELNELLNSVVFVCSKCGKANDTFDLSKVYKEINRQIYDKWDMWLIECDDCGYKENIPGRIREFFKKYGFTEEEWEKKFGKTNTIIKLH